MHGVLPYIICWFFKKGHSHFGVEKGILQSFLWLRGSNLLNNYIRPGKVDLHNLSFRAFSKARDHI